MKVDPDQSHRQTIAEDGFFNRIYDNKLIISNIDISVLNLSIGLEKKLRSINVNTLEELINFPIDDFYQLRMAGGAWIRQIRKKLHSFLSTLISLHQQTTSTVDETTTATVSHTLDQLMAREQELLKEISAKNVFLLEDYVLPIYVRTKLRIFTTFRIETMLEFQERLNAGDLWERLFKSGQLDYEKLDLLYKTINEIRRIILGSTVDEELNKFTAILLDRERDVLVRRFSEGERVTLQQLANKYKVTRERIRQVESKVKRKMERHLFSNSYILSSAALKLFERNADTVSRKSWETTLGESGFLQKASSVDLLVAVSNMDVHPDLTLSQRALTAFRWNIPLNALSIGRSIIQKACKYISNSGAVRIRSLTDNDVSRQSIESILAFGGITPVDTEWVTKIDGIDIFKRTAYKMLYYCGPLSCRQLRYGFAKHLFRLGYQAPPSDIILRVLELTGEFSQKDDLILTDFTMLEEPDCNDRELLFLELIDQEGPVVTYDRVFDKLKEGGYSWPSVPNLLQVSPIIQKIGHSLYTVLGRHYDDIDIERAQSSIRQVRRLQALKPYANGQVIYEANVSNWIKYSGVINSGQAKVLKGTWGMYIDGRYQNDLVVDNLFIRGLTKASEVLKIESGDRIKLCFDTIKREVAVSRVWNYD
jgi:hypothetical protein